MVAELKRPPVPSPAKTKNTAAELPPLSKPDWARGLKLTAHHFQIQDRYHEDLVRFAARAAFDQAWGVSQLVLDEEELAAGQVRIRRLKAVFPDGSPVVVAGESSAIPSRSFERALHGRTSLDVYVALTVGAPGASAMGTTSEAVPRYVQETATVADYNTGRNPLSVPWARPNVRVLFEGESFDGCTVIRVARLLSAEGRVRHDPRFIPPVLRVSASLALQATLRTVEKSALAAKANVGDAPTGGGELTGTDAARLLLAATLGRLLPAVQSTLASEGAHPREAYRAVAALVGSVSAFASPGAAQIPAFDYLDLQTTFETLATRAREILDALSGPTHRAVPLTRYDDNLSHGQLRESGVFGKEFLLVITGGDPATLHASLPRAAKIAAWEEIGDAVQRHLPGVPLLPELRRPHGLALPPDAACFRLDKRAPAWASVVKHASIGVWLPTGFTQLQPTLVVQERGPFA